MDEETPAIEEEQDDEELTRFLGEAEELERSLTKAEREAIALEDFAWPDAPGKPKFPIDTQEHLDSAATLIGHAPKSLQAKIKARAIRIAKRKGFTLPDSWQEDDGKGGKGRAMETELERALSTDVAQQLFVPITRIDKDEWVIEGQATSDVIDHYNTIFDYESSKKAFQKWRGNIREMHQNKAVGRAIEWTPDDDNHLIHLKARISRGAKDTWEKICDGTLSGFSIGVPAGKYKSKSVERNGKPVLMYYDHELAEVSVVDSPGSPGCDIAIVRADGMITEVLDDSEPQNAETPVPATEELPEQTRAGQRISHVTQDALHGMRDNHLRNAKSTMDLCGCEECQSGCSALDPDGDGDIDLMPTSSLDWDSDGGKSDMMADMRTVESELTRILAPMLAPTLQRYNAIAAQFAQYQRPEPQPVVQQTIDLSPLERRLEVMEQLVPGIAEVRSLLSEVKELAVHNQELAEQNRALTEQIASMPQGGGPITNSAAMDKILATQGVSQNSQPSKADVARLASQYGLLNTEQSQLAGATAQIAEILAGRR